MSFALAQGPGCKPSWLDEHRPLYCYLQSVLQLATRGRRIMAAAAAGGEPSDPFQLPDPRLPIASPVTTQEWRTCSSCRQVKPINEFIPKRGTKLIVTCLTCHQGVSASTSRKRTAIQAPLSSPPRGERQQQPRTPSFMQATLASRGRARSRIPTPIKPTAPQPILPRGISSQETPAEGTLHSRSSSNLTVTTALA